MNLRTLILSASVALIAACGGSTSTGTGSAALDAAVPSFAALSLDQTAADAVAPAAVVDSPEASLTADMNGPGGGCHPHLFMREREVVERVNRHVYKVLRLVEKVIAKNPEIATDTTKTWTRTESGVDISFTITLVGPSVYSWQLAAGATGTTPLPVVMSGEIDRNGYTGKHEGKGTMEVDFAKLHAAFPNERAASGTLEVRFDVSAASRKIAVRGTDVTWDLDAGKFDGMIPAGLTQPRSGEYVYYRVPGKGGSLKIQDELVFLCGLDPRTANLTLTPADAQMVSRWYLAADGRVHGRSDGLIRGGNLVAPVDRIVGLTCHDASADRHMPTEGYWLMKAEDATGATVPGLAAAAGTPESLPAPCDAAFGEIPLLTDSSKDFTGWPASYFEDPPFPFPGM